MLAVEVIVLAILIVFYEKIEYNNDLNIDDICLRVQAIVIVPSEFMYADEADNWFEGRFNRNDFANRDKNCQGFFLGFLPCCCCYTPAALLSSLCTLREDDTYKHPGVRIGLSMMEWIFLIIWALSIPERSKFLFSFNYGLAVFIVSGICYFIHTQYMYFFPDFSLPGKVSIRSIFGYAFNGELEEIQRLKRPKKFERISMEWDDDNPSKSKLPKEMQRDSLFGYAFYGELEKFKAAHGDSKRFNSRAREYDFINITPILLAMSNNQDHIVKYIEENAEERGTYKYDGKGVKELNLEIARAYLTIDFWDVGNSGRGYCATWDTPAMYALSMGRYHVVEYLEKEKGAKLHKLIFNEQDKFKSMDIEFARRYIGKHHFEFFQKK